MRFRTRRPTRTGTRRSRRTRPTREPADRISRTEGDVMTTWGADAAQLDALAAAFGRLADVLDQNRVRVNAQVHHAPWRGPSADRFRRDWDTLYVPHLVSAAG